MPQTVLINEEGYYDATPTYLFDYADLYNTDPHQAALNWFRAAHYGLGVDFGVHALIGKGHDVMLKDNIGLDVYERLQKKFSVEHFDAIDIVEFAIANGMRYIDFTACGPDGFCLWRSASCEFNCFNSPAHRDLLAELSSVCEYNGIGLCIRYSHGFNWRHPHSSMTLASRNEAQDLRKYLDFIELQIKELLTQYGPVAAICLEGIDIPRSDGFEKYECNELYKMIRILQPQVLISYQQGMTGDEDFFTTLGDIPSANAPEKEQGFINTQMNKPCEIIDTLTPGCCGYNPAFAGMHRRENFVWEHLKKAGEKQCNYLVTTALMPDGSLDLEDINTLLDVGKRIETNGFPAVK